MESSTERWIQLTVRDQTIPDKYGEILLKLSEVKSIVSNFERNQFEYAELCLSDNKYFIDQETVNEIKRTIEEISPIRQFSVGRYRTMKARSKEDSSPGTTLPPKGLTLTVPFS